MNVFERLASAGIVPVVVIENAENAVPTAKAMLKGGIYSQHMRESMESYIHLRLRNMLYSCL